MSVPETLPPPAASQARMRRLIQELARRIKARRLASLTPSNTSQVALGDASGPVTTPTADKIRRAGQRALLRRLVDPDRRQAAAGGHRVRGTRYPIRSSRGRR